jgi:hypothetical protein
MLCRSLLTLALNEYTFVSPIECGPNTAINRAAWEDDIAREAILVASVAIAESVIVSCNALIGTARTKAITRIKADRSPIFFFLTPPRQFGGSAQSGMRWQYVSPATPIATAASTSHETISKTGHKAKSVNDIADFFYLRARVARVFAVIFCIVIFTLVIAYAHAWRKSANDG